MRRRAPQQIFKNFASTNVYVDTFSRDKCTLLTSTRWTPTPSRWWLLRKIRRNSGTCAKAGDQTKTANEKTGLEQDSKQQNWTHCLDEGKGKFRRNFAEIPPIFWSDLKSLRRHDETPRKFNGISL